MAESTPLLPLLEERRTKFLCFHLNDKKLKLAHSVTGYTLIFLCGIAFTVANVIQRHVAPEISHWHYLLYRAFIQLILMFADVQLNRLSCLGPPGKQRMLLAMRGFSGGLNIMLIFFSIKNIPLGNSTAILFCMPIFTFLFSIPILKERFGLYRLVISVIMITGVMLIVRPPFFFPEDLPTGNGTDTSVQQDPSPNDQHVALGYLCAIAVPMLAALNSILTRQLCELRPSVILLWFSGGALFFSVTGIIGFQVEGLFDYTPWQFFCLFVVTFCGISGQVIYTIAMKWVTPSRVNVFRTNEVVINCMVSLLLEHALFHYSVIAGIVFLIVSVSLIASEGEVMQKYSERFPFL